MLDKDTVACQNGIIVVQGDEASRNLIAKQLNREVPGVTAIGSAADCRTQIKDGGIAVAIIDEVLPDDSGYVLTKFIKLKSSIPVIMLVENPSHQTRTACYLAGGIGCIERQHSLTELPLLVTNILGIKASIQEGEQEPGWKLTRQGWLLVGPDEEKVSLTIKEFVVIEQLAQAQPFPATRNELLTRFGYKDDVKGNKALEAVVHRLRIKVAKLDKDLIMTANGIGWGLSCSIGVQ